MDNSSYFFNILQFSARISHLMRNARLRRGMLLALIPLTKGPAMLDPMTVFETIRRPRLLMQAARHAMLASRRTHKLNDRATNDINNATVIAQLIAEEEKLERIRRSGEADYSVARHIELLAALIAEASRLPRLVC
ncbi:MAG: DUF6477 family protein [Paracoccaceae bacterium]